MLSFLRRIMPQQVMQLYHYVLSVSGALFYGYPSKRMMVIGITGTSGKSTTVFLLDEILTAAGHKVGSSSTIEFRCGTKHELNKTKMTQLGRWGTQRMLAQMYAAGCDIAVVETTSQGIEQFRHLGIFYDVAMLTNLYPEHIEAHGSFENYKNAKKKLFSYVATLPKKIYFVIPKTFIVNGAVAEATEFLKFSADRKWSFGAQVQGCDRTLMAQNISVSGTGVSFDLDLQHVSLQLLGEHTVDNALAAIAAANAVGVGLDVAADALAKISAVPGRTEFIDAGQPFKVMIDFAFEPVAMTKLYELVKKIPHRRIIHVLGGTGGGRDKSRRPILGNIAGENADKIFVTNEDPYDEAPREIMEQVADGVRGVGKRDGVDLEIIEDRRAAIAAAIAAASENDIILITGKGCEQAIVGPNRMMVPWDDRVVAREELAKLFSTT